MNNETVLLGGTSDIKLVKISKEDGKNTLKLKYNMEIEMSEDSFNEVFRGSEKVLKDIFQAVNDTLNRKCS
jgi:hypothetical protein